ncbi:MAG: hypothetical protein KAJ51_12930 [Thermoplasmata archaeon]|nr:hypothetical protein [Thermoplasmata archaeon]
MNPEPATTLNILKLYYTLAKDLFKGAEMSEKNCDNNDLSFFTSFSDEFWYFKANPKE